ncbi:MAG: glycine zipper 2TM domain-containing protein [Burkholderiaceae bacterium]
MTHPFSRTSLWLGLALCSTASLAQPAPPPMPHATGDQLTAQVVSVTPVLQAVQVPQQVCQAVPVAVQTPPSGAGAALGAVAGAVLGHAVGHGRHNAAATVLGAMGGAVVGNQVEGPGATQVQTAQQCTTQFSQTYRTVGYTVVYEYAGQQHTAQMPQPPGPTLRVQVAPLI